MGSNPTLVEPGKIVELRGCIYRIATIQRDAHGTLRYFTADVLMRPEDTDENDFPDVCSMEVLDEELLLVYAVH